MNIDSQYHLLYEAEHSQMTLSGRVPFTKDNTAVLFIDHEVGLFTGVGAGWRRRVIASVDDYAHPTSTLPFGTSEDPCAVVDSHGARGTSGLHIVGTSIMPDIVSVATNLATIMIAETISRHVARL